MSKITAINPEEREDDVSVETFIEIFINSLVKKEKTEIKIDGEIAFINSSFTDRFNGDFSLYEEDNEQTNITLDPVYAFKNGKNIIVKIISETVSGEKIYLNYIFKTEEIGPKIINSNFENNSILVNPQILYLDIQDYDYDINSSKLNLILNDTKIISEGVASSEYSGGTVDIDIDEGSCVIRITPDEFFRNGPYILIIEAENENGDKLRKIFNFSFKLTKFIYPAIFPPSKSSFSIIEASPVGDGKSIKVKWPDTLKRIVNSNVHILTYISEKRLTIRDRLPHCITLGGPTNEITIGDLSPGKQLYVLTRALETHKDAFDFSNLSTIFEDTYKIPSEVSVAELFGTEDLILKVDSVDGYPNSGILIIGNSEVVKYSAIDKSENKFIISSSGRGLNETSRGVFISGDKVKLFLECQDKNLNIAMVTPVYSEEHSAPERNFIGTSVTDYEDQDSKFTQSYDYCGYHRHLPKLTLNGKDDCGSYLGGDFNGTRGFDIFDRMVAREEILLDQTGEPCILFKRKWSGLACSCTNNSARHPRQKTCRSCFGTGFVGGFDQFLNKKRSDTRLQLSFGDTVEDLKLVQNKGLNNQYEPSCWALPYPTIRDRDLILRFDYTNDAEYFYEVLDVTREKSICRHYTRQRVRLKRLEKTDIYQMLTYTKNW